MDPEASRRAQDGLTTFDQYKRVLDLKPEPVVDRTAADVLDSNPSGVEDTRDRQDSWYPEVDNERSGLPDQQGLARREVC